MAMLLLVFLMVNILVALLCCIAVCVLFDYDNAFNLM